MRGGTRVKVIDRQSRPVDQRLGRGTTKEIKKCSVLTPISRCAFASSPGRWRRDEGATAVEYGLMVALIAVVIIAAVALLGNNLNTKFSTVANSIGSAS